MPINNPNYSNLKTQVNSIGELALQKPISGIRIDLVLGGRSGMFSYDSTVSAATIAADPEQGVYIASEYGGAWVRQDSGYVTPEMYGGNLVAAINSGRKVVGSEATYTMATVANITTDRQVLNLIASSVKSALTSGSAMVISANGVQLDIDYDGANQQVTPIQITNAADRTKVLGTIRNVQAKLGMVNTYIGGVDNRGSNSDINVSTTGFTNDGYTTNEAMPHGVTFQGGAIGGNVDLKAEGGNCGIVFGVCTDPHINKADLKGLIDNGVYFLEGCVNPTFDFIKYDGTEEPLVSKATGGYGSDVVIVNQVAAMGIDQADGLTIDHIVLQTTAEGIAAVKAAMVPLIQTRSGNTLSKGVTIGKVSGHSYGNNIFQFNNGVLNNVKIHNVELTHHYHNVSQSKNIYTHGGGGDSVGFRGWRLKVIDETGTLTGSDTIAFNLPTNLSKSSYYDDMRLVKEGNFKIRVSNIDQDNLAIGGRPNCEVAFGPYIREEEYLTFRKEVTSTSIPTAGRWKQGDTVVLPNAPPDSSGGWYATADIADASVDNTAFRENNPISA
jgi:hypothetical protein